MNFPYSCRALPSLADTPQFAVKRRSYPLGVMQPLGDLGNMLGSDVELSRHTAEHPIEFGGLLKLRRDTFKAYGQGVPLEYGNDRTTDSISSQGNFSVQIKRADNSPIAGKIREVRRSLALKQEVFAEMLGFDQTTVSQWERGKARPGPNALVKLASVADGVDKLFFLEHAGLPPQYFEGAPMIHEVKEAARRVVAKTLGASALESDIEILWDPVFMAEVIDAVNINLDQLGKTYKQVRYAELVVAAYNLSYYDRAKKDAIVEQISKIA